MWSLFNLTVGFKFYFGKKGFEGGSGRFYQSRVEIKRIEKFRDLSVLYQYLSSELEQGQEFRIEIFDDEETIKINSRDIGFIELVEHEECISEIILNLQGRKVPITNASAVSIVYVDEAKPTKPRLDANAGEVRYAPGTIGSRLQKIFPNVNNLTLIELMKPSALEELQIDPNSPAVLVIVKGDLVVDSMTVEEFFKIKIENQYQGTNLPNGWVLRMSTVKAITKEEKLKFIRVEWEEGKPSIHKQMVFLFSEYRFFVIKEQSTTASPDQGRKSTAAAKPGSAEALAEPAKPKIVTLRDVLLSQSSLTNLPDSEIKITSLRENPEFNLTSPTEYYYLMIVENSLLKRVQGSSSILDLPLNFSSGKISQRCNVVPLYSIKRVRVEHSNNRSFGINVSWCESGSQKTMVYPIGDYHFYLIGIPKTSGQNISEPNPENSGNENSDNGLLAKLLQIPLGTPTVVEQLEPVLEQLKSAIKAAFEKK